MKSPYGTGYVKMTVPTCFTLEQLQEVVRLSQQIASELAGTSSVPPSFSSFPINKIGNVALLLISNTMPEQLADGIEGTILLNIMAAFKFLRQILDRVANKVPMRREDYVASIVSYCNRFSPHFVDAIKMRLPMLVKQAMDANPPVPELAQRLSKLGDIALTTVASLRDIIGDEAYERWIERRTVPRSPMLTKFGGEAAQVEVEPAVVVEEQRVPEPAEVDEFRAPELPQAERRTPEKFDEAPKEKAGEDLLPATPPPPLPPTSSRHRRQARKRPTARIIDKNEEEEQPEEEEEEEEEYEDAEYSDPEFDVSSEEEEDDG